MDFSQMIQGTRQFFQGHPRIKPRDDVINGEPQLIQTKCGLKKNEPYSYNPTSYSDVMKSNCLVQSSHGTSLPQYYPRPYCEQIAYQQKVPSSYQVNEACTGDSDAKYASCAHPNISQITHKPALQHEEQNMWKNIIPSKVCDPTLKVPLNQVPTFSMAANSNPNFGPSAATTATYQGQQQQVCLKTNEFIVPATSYLHQGYAYEEANLSQYSEIIVRQPFVQSTSIVSHGHSCTSTNVYQKQRSFVPCPDNANSMNLRDQDRQQTFSKSLDSAPSLLRQTDCSSTVVSRDCLFNQNYTSPSPSNQQRILSQGLQQWDPDIQCISIGNNKIRQNKECARSAYPREQPNSFENREIAKPLQNSLQYYHSQELSKTISKNCAFIPYSASTETETLFCPSTNRPDQTVHVTESSSAKSSTGSDFCEVSVIQHSMNNRAISYGSIKTKNEERVSVINYPRQRSLGDDKSATHHISNTKGAQFQPVSIEAKVPQPKIEPALFGCESLCTDIPANSIKHQTLVNAASVKAAKAVNSSQLVKQSPNKATKPPKLKVKSLGNSVNVIPSSNAVSIDETLIQSDPIVSDEKWEEWKSSFDTEWNAFVKDLANSENIKRIYRYIFFFL
jgi:hypothetical protein